MKPKRKPPTPPRPIVTDAIRTMKEGLEARMKELVAKPLTPRSLLEIRRVAMVGHQMLLLTENMAPRQRYMTGLTLDDIAPTSDGLPDQPAPSSSAETFMSKVVREAISTWSAAQKPATSPMDLVSAISFARKTGQPELADKMEAQLLDSMRPASPVVTLPALPSTSGNGVPS